MKIQYITPEELEDFQKSLGEIIKGLDTTNPFEIIGFANSLTNMGNHYLNQITTKLIVKAYTLDELDQFKKNIKKPED
ncbi:hypothetical protein [Methanobrevibacter sp.]|uniref:hypothetical protein n=1 Tax=Methanobrevibacter sp. TaxID=66852 RepID=UPI003862FD6F